MIKLALTSVFVEDVAKAHAFYTDVLGFETRQHLDLGGGTLFITVGARDGAQRDVELLLEPGQGPSPTRTARRCTRRASLASSSRWTTSERSPTASRTWASASPSPRGNRAR